MLPRVHPHEAGFHHLNLVEGLKVPQHSSLVVQLRSNQPKFMVYTLLVDLGCVPAGFILNRNQQQFEDYVH